MLLSLIIYFPSER